MCLQDLLRKHMPNACIMTFGYNSDSNGKNALRSVKGPDYVAAKLLRLDRWVNAMLSQHLPKFNIVNRNDRCAITFIAHDMGGIVVKNVDLSIRIFSRGNTDGMDNYRPRLWRSETVAFVSMFNNAFRLVCTELFTYP